MSSVAYSERLVVLKVGMENVDVWPVQLLGHLLLGRIDAANEANDGVGRVLRELAEELELDDGKLIEVEFSRPW
jgi:hypothetical protein